MRIIITITFSFLFTIVAAQQPVPDNCNTNTSKSKITRRSYPFNRAANILIVRYDAADAQGKAGFFIQDEVNVIPKKGRSVDTTKFLSSTQLTKNGIDSLLLVINQQAGKNGSSQGVFTNPSNAIVFLDRKRRAFEYIVVCFTDIGNIINYTEIAGRKKVKLGSWCSGKGKMLVDFFGQRGIEAVITKLNQ